MPRDSFNTFILTNIQKLLVFSGKMAKFSKKRTSAFVLNNLQLILTLLSVVIGIVFGLLARSANPAPRTIELIGFPGEILMSMLKMTILPLIAASLISGKLFVATFNLQHPFPGLSQLDAKQSGRIGAYAFWYYGMTTSLAVIVSIQNLTVLTHKFRPESFSS